MRLTTPQLAMYAFLGQRLHPEEQKLPLAEVVRTGHAELVFLLGLDLGYDPRQWHDYLCAFNQSYRWSDQHLQFPPRIAEALADPEWRAAVRQLAAAPPAGSVPDETPPAAP